MIRKNKTEKLLKQLKALSQASQAVTASLDLSQVLAKIISLANKAVGSEYTTIILADEKGKISRTAENLRGIPSIELRIRKKGFTSWIMHSGKIAVVDRIAENGTILSSLKKDMPRFANPFVTRKKIKSFTGLPLRSKERLFGVIYLHSLSPNVFGRQVPILKAFANQAANALENARLFESAKKYEFIVNASREFMALINKNFVYEAINESYCWAHGKKREDIVGKSVANLWGGKEIPKPIKACSR